MIAKHANIIFAEIHFAMGEYETSKKHWQKAISILREHFTMPSQIKVYKLAILNANLMKDRKIDLETMYAIFNEIKFPVFESDAQRYVGGILLFSDDSITSKAEDWIKRAIEFDKRYGMMWNLAQDYALYAELFRRKNDVSQAKEKLNKAIDIFKESGADGWVAKYEKELAELK
jgi:tetratricopeptide (TPR) repeat protein